MFFDTTKELIGFASVAASFGSFMLMCGNMFDWSKSEALGLLWMFCWLGFGLYGFVILAKAREEHWQRLNSNVTAHLESSATTLAPGAEGVNHG